MTGVTAIGGVDVRSALATGRDAVVTRGAAANNLAVVHQCVDQRRPRRGWRQMTAVAIIGTADMCATLAAGRSAIVTTDAGANDLGMVYRSRSQRKPGCRGWLMTGVASIAGVDV